MTLTLEDAIKAVEDEPEEYDIPLAVQMVMEADPEGGTAATISMVKKNIIERLRQRHGTSG